MESILLVDRLKKAIEDDFKGAKEELDKVQNEKKELTDKNVSLHKQNKELIDDNLSLTKTLKELKDKYEHLHAKLKRKQNEIKKKEEWWDRYRFTAETMIKKLRTLGSFSPEILHEVSRDLVDIMEEVPSKEVSSKESSSSQESEVKKHSKLTTSKKGKKKIRYTEVSPESATIKSNTSSIEANELKSSGTDEKKIKKEFQQEDIPQEKFSGSSSKTAQPQKVIVVSDALKKRKTNMSREVNDVVGKKVEDVDTSMPRIKQENIIEEPGAVSKFAKKEILKNSYEKDFNHLDHDDEMFAYSIGYPSLTSTPVFSSSNKKPLLSAGVLADLSIIPKDKTNDAVNIEATGGCGSDSTELTPAVPTIFKNLLSRKTSALAEECNSTARTKGKGECIDSMEKQSNLISESKSVYGKQMTRDDKYSYNENLRIVIPDINKLQRTDKCRDTSPSILRNTETRGRVYDDTIDYPIASEENAMSPSILAGELLHGEEPEDPGILNEDKCRNLRSTGSSNGTKRKRSCEDREMKITQYVKGGRQKPLDKKPYQSDSGEVAFKMPTKPPHSIKIIKGNEQVHSPEGCSIVLLSDEEDDNRMESSSVDMFADSGKSKDHSSEKDVIDMIQNEEGHIPSNEMAVPSSSRCQKVQVLNKDTEDENKYLDEEFPGFRKPDELNYKNIKVVRKKNERAKLNGFSCRDCEAYFGEMTGTELKKRLKGCSRHRAKYSPPPSTPPGFWNLSFPDTQEYIENGMLVTGDKVPPQRPRRPRKRRLLKPVQK